MVAPGGRTVAEEVYVVRGLLDRARGLLAYPRLGEREALLLPRAKQIHTFGMRYPIDVIFCGPGGEVIRLVRHMRPHRITRLVIGARSVLEMRAGAAGGVAVGDRLMLVQSPFSARPR